MKPLIVLAASLTSVAVLAQTLGQPDWKTLEPEILRHYQTLLRFDTVEKERPATEYIKRVLDEAGIPAQILAENPDRPNVVARIKGSGKKRPILILGHTDTVPVDPKKWKFPPFSATRDGGYVYGRGTIDDKDNATAGLMIMLELKRLNVALDRDVIFLSESGEEGNSRVGIQFMANQHFPDIDAEYCFAEGGTVTRVGGQVKYAQIQTLEKIPHAIELVASGTSGHASMPLPSNAVVHMSAAVAAVGKWQPDIRLNETTGTYFRRLAAISTGADAQRYRDVLVPNSPVALAADAWFLQNEPRHSSMLRTSVSPTIVQGGYRINVIPSDAKATLDVRMLPDEDPAKFLEQVKTVINDPAIDVHYTARDVRERTPDAKLDSEAFKAAEAAVTKIYNAPTLPTMSTGATDMAYLRTKGVQCFGVGPATDIEDIPLGFNSHSDQERLLESELYRFVRFHWDFVYELARAR